MDRRGFLRATVATAVGLAAASCAQPTPQVIEKEVPVEKVVKETVVVEKQVAVEKVVTATPVPVKYKESPVLAGLVAAGKLPPVDERLPLEPMVITPWEEIGQYGGTWHHLATSASDTQLQAKMTYEWMVRYDKDGANIVPNIAKSWEISPDGKVFTFNLRKGMKWSDGEPYTADDVLFIYEDNWGVKELGSVPSVFKSGGKPIVIEKVDDVTVRCKFEVPYGLFMRIAAGINGDGLTNRCKHYLSQFHIKYADKAKLEAATKAAGFENWYQLYGSKTDPRLNPDLPVLYAWRLTVAPPKVPIVAERNPYYWKVDTEGNQLPYLDRIEFMLVETAAQAAMRVVQGEADMQLRHVTFDNYPLLMENKEKGDYRVLLWDTGRFDVVLGINQSCKDPVLREILGDKRFRWALSLGIKRSEIIEAAFLGTTEPNQVSPLPTSAVYIEEQAKNKVEHDPAKANAYLDEMGLTKRDAEGYRLRPDGKRLSLVYEYAPVIGAWGMIGELLAAHFKEIGVEMLVKEEARQLFEERAQGAEVDIAVWTGSGEFDPLIQPRCFVPWDTHPYHLRQYAIWWSSGGKEGEEPTGDLLKTLEIWEKVKVAVSDEEQNTLFKEIVKLNQENMWMIGICTPGPTLVVAKNNFRNVPEKAMFDDQVRGPGNTMTEQYFIKS